MIKGNLKELLKDIERRPVLKDLLEDGFVNVECEGKYYVMCDEQGIIRYYDVDNDIILPFIEKGEYY